MSIVKRYVSRMRKRIAKNRLRQSCPREASPVSARLQPRGRLLSPDTSMAPTLLGNPQEPTRHYSPTYKYLSLHLKLIAIDPRISVNHLTAHLTQSNTCPAMSLIPSDVFGGRRTSIFDPFSSIGGRTSIFDPFSLDIWDPFLDFPFTRSTALSLPRSDVSREVAQFASARIDWRETPEAHVFQADLPGMRKDEVRVEVEEGRVLSISGERRREKEEVTDTWHRLERGSGRFSRRFRLPEDARVDQVRASMENGVLTVVVPKAAAAVARPNATPIPITG